MTELTKAMEQYLETIYGLQEERGSASVTDIADVRGVKAPSVTYVLQKLKKLGLVNYKKYRSVSLTPEGMAIAERLEKTHQTLKWFFCLIGIDEEVAEADACEFEHTAHPETVEKLTEFVDWVKAAPKDPKWLEHFRKYQKNGSYPGECQ
ncbi:MAG: metal-dependent transcriptional regulator [Candidatus Thorarchaeota archaeon]|jgi:DtxR family Mn-dependent transcriptional regulator|nr:metal-dependent transcriptional regulator [Candidatus Thorarchaeota archaeon]